MISSSLNSLLNEQVYREAEASNLYLAMASWAEIKGYEGISTFFYHHSDEERMHMLKLFRYVNERGGKAMVPDVAAVKHDFDCVQDLFKALLDSEVKVSGEINNLVAASLEERDYITHNFLQWYVAEQMEEERLARTLLDKLHLIGDDKAGLYLFDSECAKSGEQGQ